MPKVVVGWTLAIACAVAPAASAAEPVFTTGGALIPVQDGTTSHNCIDVSANNVSVQLVEAQLNRSQSWFDSLFKKKKALGVKFDVVITDSQSKTFDFPRAQQVGTTGQTSDIALLPIQYSVMSNYPMIGAADQADKGVPYNNVELDLYFVVVDTGSHAFNALTSLVSFSKSLPLPTNPYTTGVQYFGQFANQIEQQMLSNGAAENPDAVFSFNLANSQDDAANHCSVTKLHEGVQAVVWDYSGSQSGNFIQAANSSSYCYWFMPGSNRLVYAALPPAGTCSSSAPVGVKPLDNPLVAFIVDSDPRTGTGQAPPAATIQSLQPTIGAKAITAGEVSKFADSVYGTGSRSALNVHPNVVAGVLGELNTSTTDLGKRSGLASQATVEDAATTVALKRCAVVGIDAAHCNR